jgi:hypothetical protein
VTRWSKRYDWGDGPDSDAPESFFFLVARAVAKAFDITLPEDLKLTAERAIKIQRDASEAMKAAQDAELAARARQRLGDLAVRLKAAAPPAAPQPARHHLGIILRKRPLR